MASSTALTNGTNNISDGNISPKTVQPDNTPQITLYFLQCSRSIRVAWLLEALALPYTLKFYNRLPSGACPEEFIKDVGGGMGKAPVLRDGDLLIEESGAIVEAKGVKKGYEDKREIDKKSRYLCKTYDHLNQLLPADITLRTKLMTYIHAAEGTYFLHGLVPFYISRVSSETASQHHDELCGNTAEDLDYLDAELAANGTRYLVGDTVTAADIMMAFSVQFVLKFNLVPEDYEWENVNAWLERIENNRVYKRAVARTGHKLEL